MDRTESTRAIAPEAISHENARCVTRSDSLDNKPRFSHLPVSIATGNNTPKCLGVVLQDNSHILSARAWTVEYNIGLAKIARHTGKKLIGAAREKISDIVTNLAFHFFDTEHCWRAGRDATLASSRIARCYSGKVLDMLHMVTNIRNIQGSESDWREHFNYLKAGESNPRFPKTPLLDHFTEKAIECEELRQNLNLLIKIPGEKTRPSHLERMKKLEKELVSLVGQLYRETTENLEAMTGFTINEILDEAYGTQSDFYTPETLNHPDDEKELAVMTVAKGYGLPDREQLEGALRGDLSGLAKDILDEATKGESAGSIVKRISDDFIANTLNQQLREADHQISLNDIRKLCRQNSP